MSKAGELEGLKKHYMLMLHAKLVEIQPHLKQLYEKLHPEDQLKFRTFFNDVLPKIVQKVAEIVHRFKAVATGEG
jgi:hypothetical protein